MRWNNIALVAAGAIGAITAILHGIVMQIHMIVPLQDVVRKDARLSGVAGRLIAPLLHVSTLAWFAVGLLLIWAGLRATGEARWVVGAVAAAIYGHAAVANLLAVRGLHPGWMLMAIALALILLGAR